MAGSRRAFVALSGLALALRVEAMPAVRVVGPDGPIAAASIVVKAGDGMALLEDPRTQAAALDGAPLDACVMADGFVPQVVRIDPAAAEQVVALARATSLAGRVTDPQGAPIALSRVRRVVEGPLPECGLIAIADEQGAFTLGGLPSGHVLLAVEPPVGALAATVPVRLPRARQDLRVHRSFLAAISVVDEKGAPLAGATVRVLPEWDDHELAPPLDEAATRAIDEWTATTDATGRVQLPPLPRRASWRVVAAHPSKRTTSLPVAGERATAHEVLRLGPGAALTVRVLDEEGLAWPDAWCRLHASDVPDLDLEEIDGFADQEGRIDLRRLPPGRYAVELRARSAVPREIAAVELVEGRVTALGDVVLVPGDIIAGRVDSGGGPLSLASVTLHGWIGGRQVEEETVTDSEGVFLFEGLDPEGDARLRVTAPGHVGRWVDAEPGDEEIVIALERGARLVVDVRDAATQDAVAEATVVLDADEPGRFPPASEGHPPVFDGVPSGTWSVRASAPGYLRGMAPPVSLAAGEARAVMVELKRGVALDGIVIAAATREPVASASVRATSPTGVDASALTNDDGTFQLDGVEGTVTVVVDHPAFVPATRPGIDASSGERLAIELEQGAVLEGRVMNGDEPVASSRIGLLGGGHDCRSRDDGTYRLEGIAPGRQTIERSDARGVERVALDFTRGQVTRHDFGTTGRLSGTITRGGLPLGGVRVSAMRVDAGADGGDDGLKACLTREDGRYELAGLRPGRHGLSVNWRNDRLTREIVYPEGVAEHRQDVDFPEIVAAGIVRERSGGSIDGTFVSASLAEPTGDAHVSTAGPSPDGGPMILAGTMPNAMDRADGDGRFELVLSQAGAWRFSAHREGCEMAEDPEQPRILDVSRSRSDLVLEIDCGAGSSEVEVRVRDAATGTPLDLMTVLARTPDGSSTSISTTSGGRASFTFPAGKPQVIAGMSPGHAPEVRMAYVPEAPVEQLDFAVSPGGSLRIAMPPGTMGADGRPDCTRVDLLSPEGFDWTSLFPAAEGVRDVRMVADGDGRWVFQHLPPGPLTVKLRGDAGEQQAQVEVIAGTAIDLSVP